MGVNFHGRGNYWRNFLIFMGILTIFNQYFVNMNIAGTSFRERPKNSSVWRSLTDPEINNFIVKDVSENKVLELTYNVK